MFGKLTKKIDELNQILEETIIFRFKEEINE